MKYVSLFSGIEAASVAWGPLGWEPMAFSEIDPFPCAVLKKRYPDVPNLGDITKIDWSDFIDKCGKPDLVVGGSPCFPAGALVLCEDGFRSIETVKVGDKVVTHKGRLKKVLATGHKRDSVVWLTGEGSTGIECTANHPFFAKETPESADEPTWLEAEHMDGKAWMHVNSFKRMPIPPFGGTTEFTPEFFNAIGLLVGCDALVFNCGKTVSVSFVTDDHAEKRKFLDVLDKAGLTGKGFGFRCGERSRLKKRRFCEDCEDFTFSFSWHSTELCVWLMEHFLGGLDCLDGKWSIPTWLFGMDERFRKAFFDGFVKGKTWESDVERENDSFTVAIAENKGLALGIQVLAGTLGLASNHEWGIEFENGLAQSINRVFGGEGNARKRVDRLTFREDATVSDGGWWETVDVSFPNEPAITVYNLEVEDDNSYTVDGIAVHNCQSFSIAGNRTGLEGASGLMFEYIRAVQELRPKWFLWENVPGALSVEGGGAFGQLLSEMDDLGYGLAWRILDAQFTRVPMYSDSGGLVGFVGPVAQRRRRLFLVGSLGTDDASEVLFEPESMRGDNLTSREKRQELTRAAGRDTAVNRECLTSWDCQAKRVYSPDMACPTLNSGTGEGMNIQPTVLQPCGGFKYHAGSGAGNIGWDSEMSPTLTASWHNPAVIYGVYADTPPKTMEETASTMRVGDDGDSHMAIAYSQFGDVAGTLTSRYDGSPNVDGGQNVIAFAQNNREEVRKVGGDGSVVGALPTAQNVKSHGFVMQEMPEHENPDVIAFAQNTRDEVRLQGGDGWVAGALCADAGAKQQTYVLQTANGNANGSNVSEDDVSYTIDRSNSNAVAQCMTTGQANAEIVDDMCPTLNTAHEQPIASYPIDIILSNGDDVIGTLAARDGKGVGNQFVNEGKVVTVASPKTIDGDSIYPVEISDGTKWVVRRLTPLECERLMGFPDKWTDIGDWVDDRGKTRKCADSNRYKALGNSMAVPVMMWLGVRIAAVDAVAC